MTADAAQRLKPKIVVRKVKAKGAPAYLVSFGDMMTLILCFFILLVAMSKSRNFGLMARGLGSFVVQVRSMGLTGILSGHEERAIFEQMRRRFNLPPEDDPERRAVHEDAALQELVRASSLEKLRPHDEIRQPAVASFGRGATQLNPPSAEYLDALVDSLRPRSGQTLVLEGYAPDEAPSSRLGTAHARARSVADYLVREHDVDPAKVRVRTWYASDPDQTDQEARVDARLISPPHSER